MLNREDTGLIVVDVQGRLATLVAESQTIIANTVNLVKGAKMLGLPIVWLEQNPQKLGSTVPELAAVLQPELPLAKETFDGWGDAAVRTAIQRHRCGYWLLCGIETHICVYQTARSLLSAGYGVELVADCCASRALTNKQLALDKLVSLGVGLSSLEMCCYELLVDCRDPSFKAILDLVK